METLSRIQKWGDAHHPFWFDFFRIALGMFLCWKGVLFATHLSAFTELMTQTPVGQSLLISLAAHAVIAVHLLGGLLIALGTHTRLACLFQLPILLIAVFYVNLPAKIAGLYSEFWLSVAVLVALVFFIVEGNGPLSVEHENKPKHRVI
jgi:putative oxidoreductase